MNKRFSDFSKFLSLLTLVVLVIAGCVSLSPSDVIPYLSAQTGDLDGVMAYINDGGRIDARSEISGNDCSLLWKAAEYGQLEIVTYLVEQGAYVDNLGRKRDGTNIYSPYSVALFNGHTEVADYLAEHGGTQIIK